MSTTIMPLLRLPRVCAVAFLAFVIALGVAGCAAPAAVPSQTQPALTQLAQPYAADLRRVGINSVTAYDNGARVRMATRYGEVYFRYPAGVPATSFVVYVEPQGVEVDSDAFTPAATAQYEAAFRAILPQAVNRAGANNVQQEVEGLGGGGGRR